MGKLYGVGVGPGDPELLTIKAMRIIRTCEVILVPGECVQDSVAYQIARQAYPEIEKKELVAVLMPMTRDKQVLERAHKAGAQRISAYLEQGRDVAFLTLGDPVVYSTYMYVHKLIKEQGFETEIVNGIPSFCAAAARLNMGLTKGNQELHILPSASQVTDGLLLPGTKVLMKTGRKLNQVREELKDTNQQVWMVQNCGMKNEQIYEGVENIPKDAGYYSLILVKEREQL